MNRLTRHTQFVATSVFVLALAGAANAQNALLPANIVTAAQLGPADLTAIAAAIKPQVQALTGPADQITTARKQLLGPLATTGNPSVPFRLRYAEELSKQLTPLLSGDNQMAKINALVLAGELGTSDAARLLPAARKDTDPSVRFQAADAARAILATYANARGGTLLSDDDARTLVTDTAKLVAAEKDPLVQDALLAALEAGVGNAKLQESAAKGLADAANAIARSSDKSAADPRVLEALQRVADTFSNVLTRQGDNMNAATKVAIGDFAASTLWHVKQAIGAKSVPGGEAQALRDSYANLAGSSENVLLRAGQSLASTFKMVAKDSASKIKQGNNQGDAAFVADANELIAAAVAQPFGIAATRYK